jgi:hypothetical protein
MASRGFEAKDHAMVKLEQDLAPTDRCNGEEQVKSRSCDDMKWIISFEETKWAQGKGITIGPFCFALKTP